MNKILIVEDDARAQSLLKVFFESKGLSVESALDGMEGLEKLKKGVPDLVLLDVIMPKLDGYGFIREIKKVPEWRSLPVVVFTAREMLRDMFVQEGVKDFVLKPYDPAVLYDTIAKYL